VDLAEEENWNELLAFDDFLFTTIETFACSWTWLLQNICSFSIYEKVGFWLQKMKRFGFKKWNKLKFSFANVVFCWYHKRKTLVTSLILEIKQKSEFKFKFKVFLFCWYYKSWFPKNTKWKIGNKFEWKSKKRWMTRNN